MRAVLLWLIGLSVAAVLLAAATVWVIVWSLQRRNRVSRGRPSSAPVTWLWSPRRAARLHRRLQTAVATARGMAGRRPPGAVTTEIKALIAALEGEAVALDDLVVIAGRARGAPRAWGLDAVEAGVVQVESLSRRIALIGAARAGGATDAGPEALAAISERLDALEAARRELQAIEAYPAAS